MSLYMICIAHLSVLTGRCIEGGIHSQLHHRARRRTCRLRATAIGTRRPGGAEEETKTRPHQVEPRVCIDSLQSVVV